MSGSPDPVAQVDAYVASLRDALGSRDALETLAATPRNLAEAVAGLTPGQAGTPEAPGKWSVRQVVQHLAVGFGVDAAIAVARHRGHGDDGALQVGGRDGGGLQGRILGVDKHKPAGLFDNFTNSP